MWPDEDGVVCKEKPRQGSELVISDDAQVAAHQAPSVANLNITKSSRVHVGNNFISQNIQSNDVVKGRFLGLELVSPAQARRLRCSVAVFVCWAVTVSAALTLYLVYFTVLKQRVRLDIDLPFPRYLVSVVKNTTRAERLACVGAVLLAALVLTLALCFTVSGGKREVDVPPHEWRITREMWLAKSYEDVELTEEYEPLRLVVVQHTVSTNCDIFRVCAAELRNLQDYYLLDKNYDIPYNFLIGNDGRVYEGRGWGVVGAHTKGYNRCSLGIGFIGDYRTDSNGYTRVTESQLNRTLMILEEGVKLGRLHPHYLVVGAKDLQGANYTESPGANLHDAIRKWKHFDHQNRYKNMNCEEIYSLPFDT